MHIDEDPRMADAQPYVLFRDDSTGQVMLFAEPAEIIIARTRAEFFHALDRMETAKAAGKWLAGYMAYEATCECIACAGRVKNFFQWQGWGKEYFFAREQ